MTRFLALIAATLLAVAAHGRRQQGQVARHRHEVDGDIRVARQECRLADQQDRSRRPTSMLSDSFAALDTNGDGYLSKSEFMARSKT